MILAENIPGNKILMVMLLQVACGGNGWIGALLLYCRHIAGRLRVVKGSHKQFHTAYPRLFPLMKMQHVPLFPIFLQCSIFLHIIRGKQVNKWLAKDIHSGICKCLSFLGIKH
jgi:hypothetical protein